MDIILAFGGDSLQALNLFDLFEWSFDNTIKGKANKSQIIQTFKIQSKQNLTHYCK